MTHKNPPQILYEAYSAHTGGLTYNGNPMPTWDDLPPNIQEAWGASTRALVSIILNPDFFGVLTTLVQAARKVVDSDYGDGNQPDLMEADTNEPMSSLFKALQIFEAYISP